MNIIPRIQYPKLLDDLEKKWGKDVSVSDLHLAIRYNFAIFNPNKIADHIKTMEQLGMIKRNDDGFSFHIIKTKVDD